MANQSSSAIALLLNALDQGYDRKAWHGPNLKGSIRRVDEQTAVWRPSPERHNIWEQSVHAAYWKYAAWRRLVGEKRGSFPLKGSNWFVRPIQGDGRTWKDDVKLLDEMHRLLRAAVEKLPPKQLDVIPPGAKTTNATLIIGIAAHDVYHAGQIQLLKRLAAEKLRNDLER